MDNFGVVLFHTTSAAFAAEKALNKAEIDCALVPVPRQFSSDCGISLRFDWNREPEVAQLLQTVGVETAAIHRIEQ